VEIAKLYEDAATGASAALLRYAPGARVPEHTHQGFEHVFVLEGEQSDDRGSYPAGTLIVNPPGSGHAVFSKNGCVALLIWQKPVQFRDELSD
jgi:anti-sigma factor ChrR (cupin superfamily)